MLKIGFLAVFNDRPAQRSSLKTLSSLKRTATAHERIGKKFKPSFRYKLSNQAFN